jgi:hypothetical protein
VKTMDDDKRKLIKKYLALSNKLVAKHSGSSIVYRYFLEGRGELSRETNSIKELFKKLQTISDIEKISVAKFRGISVYDLSFESPRLNVKTMKIDKEEFKYHSKDYPDIFWKKKTTTQLEIPETIEIYGLEWKMYGHYTNKNTMERFRKPLKEKYYVRTKKYNNIYVVYIIQKKKVISKDDYIKSINKELAYGKITRIKLENVRFYKKNREEYKLINIYLMKNHFEQRPEYKKTPLKTINIKTLQGINAKIINRDFRIIR